MFKIILDNIKDGIIIFDSDLNPIYMNQATIDLSGYSNLEEINKIKIDNIIHPSNKNALIEIVDKLNNQNDIFEKNILFYNKKREITLAKTISKKISFMDKSYTMLTWHDITKEKYLESELIKSKKTSQKLFDLVGLIVIAIDKNQNVTLINKKGCEILGYESDQIIGKNWFDNFIPKENQDKVKRIFNSLMEGKIESVEKHQNLIITKEKSKKLISWTNTIIKDDEGKILGTMSSGEDVTDVKKLETEREDLIIKLAKSKKEIEEFIYSIGHDLKSPIVNIQGFSNELNESIKELLKFINESEMNNKLKKLLLEKMNKEIVECLNFITISSNKMILMINGLLKLSKIGFINLNFKMIDMNQCIKEVLDLFKFKISDNKINLSVDNLPECYGDEAYINQAISNLIDNSIKYIPSERKGEIKISGHKEKNFSLYFIEDNGIGIPENLNDKVFDIFFRTRQSNIFGEGLGLTIVKKIIEIHNGKIKFESVLNKGTKFILQIPNKILI
ncbi:MAG: PAS domain-containing sensor histidine kinase [Spirochaetes bacterium]|nr:PAS domain-containing sensor histidine kinase [Spirochaetota bacterium]